MSVDHWRAGLRATVILAAGKGKVLCQSIIGALACAPEFPLSYVFDQTACQSIIGALACAPNQAKFSSVPSTTCQSIIGALACAPSKLQGTSRAF